MALSTSTTPEQLNTAYESQMYIWDRLETLPEKAVVDVVNDTFNRWQDWYWGYYEQWPIEQIGTYIDRYNTLEKIIAKAKSQTSILPEPPKEQPLSPNVIELPPEYVYGHVPPEVKPAGIKRGIMWGIAAVLATIFLSKAA